MPNTLKRLTLAEIHPNPLNPRRELRDIPELANAILAQGLEQPLLVQKNGDGYVIVTGHRRHAAISLLVEDGRCDPDWPIDCLVQPQHGDADVVAQMLVENLQRSDLTPIEEMDGFVKLSAEYGWSTKEIAAQTGVPESTVKSRVSWAKLPDHILKAITEKSMSITVANDLASLPADAIEVLCSNRKRPGPWEIDNYRARRKRENLSKKLTKRLRDAGHTVVTAVEFKAPDSAVEKLIKKLESQASKDENLGRTSVRVRGEDVETYMVGLKAGQLFVLEDITYYVTFSHHTVAPQRKIYNGTTTMADYMRDDAVDTEAPGTGSPVVAPIAQLPSRIAYDEAVKAWNERNAKFQAEIEDARRTFVAEGKTAELQAQILRFLITDDYMMEGIEADTIAGVLKLEITGPADDEEPETAEEWDAFAEAFAAYANKSAANLVRAAAAVLTFNQYQGIIPPGIEPPGAHPQYSQFIHLDTAGNSDVEDDDTPDELAPGEADAIEQIERAAEHAQQVADEERGFVSEEE